MCHREASSLIQACPLTFGQQDAWERAARSEEVSALCCGPAGMWGFSPFIIPPLQRCFPDSSSVIKESSHLHMKSGGVTSPTRQLTLICSAFHPAVGQLCVKLQRRTRPTRCSCLHRCFICIQLCFQLSVYPDGCRWSSCCTSQPWDSLWTNSNSTLWIGHFLLVAIKAPYATTASLVFCGLRDPKPRMTSLCYYKLGILVNPLCRWHTFSLPPPDPLNWTPTGFWWCMLICIH